MSYIKVLIADDHPIVCKGIHDLLRTVEGITVVGEAHSGEQALKQVKSLKPDVLLLDMEMPDLNGVEVTKRLVEEKIPVKILGLSSYDDREYIYQFLKLNASGYLIKDEVPEVIVEAVRGVARGEKGWVSHRVAAMLSRILQGENENNRNLTIREIEVVRLVADGKTNAEIGLGLGISEKTVEKHMDAIFRKLGASSRVEVAVLAVKEKLV